MSEKPYVIGQIVLAPGEKHVGPKMDFPPWLPVDVAKVKREAFAAGVRAMREAVSKAISQSLRLSGRPTDKGPMTDEWNTACLVLQDIIGDLPDPEP